MPVSRLRSTLSGTNRVFTVASLGLAGLVCHADRRAKSALAACLLASLARDPDLLATLAAFLHVDLAPSLAAQELSVGRHTLSYRLDKRVAITGLDPRRFCDVAQLHAAVLFQQVEVFELGPPTES